LKQYNKELLIKKRLLAISKSDMLDEELMKAIKKELPRNVPHLFISSATGYNIPQLKDMLWKLINDEA
jgi:GTP-binding protein